MRSFVTSFLDSPPLYSWLLTKNGTCSKTIKANANLNMAGIWGEFILFLPVVLIAGDLYFIESLTFISHMKLYFPQRVNQRKESKIAEWYVVVEYIQLNTWLNFGHSLFLMMMLLVQVKMQQTLNTSTLVCEIGKETQTVKKSEETDRDRERERGKRQGELAHPETCVTFRSDDVNCQPSLIQLYRVVTWSL